MTRWTMICTVLVAVAAAGLAGEEGSPDGAPFGLVRVFADAEGVSHFDEASLELTEIAVVDAVAVSSAPIAVDGLRFFCFADGTRVDWHPAPRRQLYLILSGELQLEVGDGEVRRFEAGDVLRGEATEGRGVRAEWHGDPRACVAVAPLAQADE